MTLVLPLLIGLGGFSLMRFMSLLVYWIHFPFPQQTVADLIITTFILHVIGLAANI